MLTSALLSFALLHAVPMAPPACVAPGLPATPVHAELLELVNAYRLSVGAEPVQYSKALELAAQEYAEAMANGGFFDHTDPLGHRAPDRATEAGFCHRRVGENLYWGLNRVQTASEAMIGWQHSPGHDRNLRRPSYRFAGFGIYVRRTEGRVETWWVQLFADP